MLIPIHKTCINTPHRYNICEQTGAEMCQVLAQGALPDVAAFILTVELQIWFKTWHTSIEFGPGWKYIAGLIVPLPDLRLSWAIETEQLQIMQEWWPLWARGRAPWSICILQLDCWPPSAWARNQPTIYSWIHPKVQKLIILAAAYSLHYWLFCKGNLWKLLGFIICHVSHNSDLYFEDIFGHVRGHANNK